MFKKYITIVALFLFISFPFIYFYQLIKSHNSLLLNPTTAYPLMTVLGLFLAFFTDKSLRDKMQTDTKNMLFVMFAVCIWIYAAFLLLMTWSRYVNFVSEAIDVHYFHQTIWQLSEFKIPYIWRLDQIEFAVWSQHFSPILVFLAPIYWFVKDAGSLMFIQAVVVISGAYPIYLIAKHHFKSRSIGLALGFAYLAFGGLQFGIAYGFHEIMLFPTLFLWTYYFYLRRKIKSYFLFVVLCLFVKEEVAFIMIFWSLYLLLVKKDKFIGISTGMLGLLWYFLCFNIIFPYFNKGGYGYWGQYQQEGGLGLVGITKFALFKPLDFLQTLVTPTEKIYTILQTFGSFSFLLFLFLPSFIIVIPSLMQKLLSSNIAMVSGAHYSAAITAVVIVATFEAFSRFYKYKFIQKMIHDKSIFFSALIFYLALFSNVFYGYRGYSLLPFVHNSIYERGLSENNSLLLNKIIQSIPDKATVSSQYQITPHLRKHYKKITNWPTKNPTEDFIIIDTELLPVLTDSKELNWQLDKMAANTDYVVAVSNAGIAVYRKKSFKP